MNRIMRVSLQDRVDAMWAMMIKYAEAKYPVKEFTIQDICEHQQISKPMALRVFRKLISQYKVTATKRHYRSNVGVWHFRLEDYNAGQQLSWWHEESLAKVRQVASNKFHNRFMMEVQ